MDASRYEKLKHLLLTARELPREERTQWIVGACGENRSLCEDARELLKHEDEELVAVDRALLAEAVAELEHDESDRPTRIGRYRILDTLGQGGMGVVYHAEQAEPIRRDVALKLIKRGMDTDRIVARFEAERQTLALMDHPYIARVLDAGADESGRPYFVMELVRGQAITAYCDVEKMSLSDRLSLFLDVCSAVQHAHQKGIVHRDLKPSNVLVAAEEAGRVPKVIDFGIAKALDPLDDAPTMTRAGQAIGTPEYMSPEQAGALDAPVDVRTDVYSLGALLYELLTGHRPHRFRSSHPSEVVRVLAESDPLRPSTAITTRESPHQTSGESSPQEVSRNRALSVSDLRRELAGDLDNIVLMALRREPERRYGSVDALADDIRRYRDGLPVRACEDTWTYRTKKFVARNRLGVSLAGVAFVALAAFGVTMTVQSRQIAAERDRAVAAEQRASAEAETAKQVADFLVQLFEVSDPNEARGNSITAREILDEGARRIDTELEDQPAVRATLMDTIGRVYHGLGLYPEALRLVEEALATREDTFGAEHLEVARSQWSWGVLLKDVGRAQEAAEPLRGSLKTMVAELGEDHAEALRTRSSLASVLQDLGALDEAEVQFRRLLEADIRTLGPEHPFVALDYNDLASVLLHQGDMFAAESLYRKSLELNRLNFGDNHPEVATNLSNLCTVLSQLGEYDRAIDAQKEALAIRTKVLGPDHPHTAISVGNLAAQYQKKGDLAKAEELYRESLTTRRNALGDVHPSVAHNYLLLGGVALKRDALQESKQHYLESLKIYREVLPQGHPNTARALNGVGRVEIRLGELEDAEVTLREALNIRREALPAGHLEIAEALNSWAELHITRGEREPAETALQEAYEAYVAKFGTEHRRSRAAATRLVELYEKFGDDELAAEYSKRAESPSAGP